MLKGVCDKSSSNDEMPHGVRRWFTFPGDFCVRACVCMHVCDLNLVQSGQIVSKGSFSASIVLPRRGPGCSHSLETSPCSFILADIWNIVVQVTTAQISLSHSPHASNFSCFVPWSPVKLLFSINPCSLLSYPQSGGEFPGGAATLKSKQKS